MSDTQLFNLVAWSAQVALLTAAAALLARIVRVDAPAVGYLWWRSVLVLCLLLPALQSWQPQVPAAFVPPPAEAAAAPLANAQPAAVSVDVRSTATALPSVGAIAAMVLAAGALARLAWLLAGLLRLRRIRRGAAAHEPGPHDVRDLLRAAGAEVRYAAVRQPVTFGLRRSIVLLPESLRSMPDGVQRAVLTHELWHVRRRDWVWGLGEEVLRSVLWFHPAVWYLVSRVQGAREEVVDELSVLATNARRSYLEALLAFADEPAIYPAAPFIRRRQLFNRMMLISREAVMSPRRIVASVAAMTGVLVAAGWCGVLAFPLTADPALTPQSQAQPRDPKPGTAGPATSREAEFKSAVAAEPGNVKNWLALAKLQEERGAIADAESTYQSARTATGGDREVLMATARFYTRSGDFDKSISLLEDVAAQNPGDPTGHQLVATYYWEKAQKDKSLTPADRLMYIESGIRATDRALAQRADYVEALTYKNILLRMKANVATDPAERQRLIAEANTLRNRAMELAKARPASAVPQGAGAPPPPPPPPPPPDYYVVDGQQAVRVGGDVKTPIKVKDVRPVYPEAAFNDGVKGIVILEVVLDTQGSVHAARVVRSVPGLDDAALDAVKQWRFEPTIRDGVPVPVIMTVTVNFTID
jgi:TonB family protein